MSRKIRSIRRPESSPATPGPTPAAAPNRARAATPPAADAATSPAAPAAPASSSRSEADWERDVFAIFHARSPRVARRARVEADEPLLAVREVMARAHATPAELPLVRAALFRLVLEKRLMMVTGERFARAAGRDEVIGRLRVRPSGKAFVALVEPIEVDGEPVRDVLVREEDRATAFGGDLVRVLLLRRSRDRVLGAVTQVLERASEFVVGLFSGDQRAGRLVPRAQRIDREVLVGGGELLRAWQAGLRPGQWAVARVTRWTEGPRPLEGQLTEVLGDFDDAGTDVTILLRQHGCAESFPQEVEAEAAAFAAAVTPDDLAGRHDLRSLLTFTIDGADSKDFDDAISIERTSRDRWRLGVHIADVSHFVREGTALDLEALERSTSIYPLDRVVPMLPERLSNDLCSLRPREDRLAMSCLMEVDAAGEIAHYEVCASVIHSDHRLTYDQVQAVFDAADEDGGSDGAAARHPDLPVAALLEARTLARHLVAMKERRGALDLDVPEAVVRLDADGRVLDVTTRARHESHRLIEEFMTLCNEVVGRHMKARQLPALYRVHDLPDQAAVERIAPVLRGLNLPISLKEEWGPRQIQALLERTEGLEGGHILRALVLRSMKRAIYQPENIGHFGLGSTCYLHFTSPIRRYPDLIVHRILRESLEAGGLPDARRLHFVETLPHMGLHCSERERDAQRIEWDVEKMKGLEFMQRRLGDEFTGYVSGCGARGAFVELTPHPVEGMIPMKSLPGWWSYDEETMVLVEENTGRRLRIGDRVEVVVERVDPLGLQMDLRMLQGGRVVEGAPAYREKAKPRGGGGAGGAGRRASKGGATGGAGRKGGAGKGRTAKNKQRPRPFGKFR